MFSKIIAAAAVVAVSAADVPVFSSNDDYDEINLNIRMLNGANTTTGTGAPAPSGTGGNTVSGSLSTVQTGPDCCDAANQATCASTMCTGYMVATGATACDGTTTCAGRRLSEGRRLNGYVDATTPYTQPYAYTATFTDAAAAAAAVQNFDEAAVGTAIQAAFVANPTLGVTVSSVTATTPTQAAAPGPAPASPSPSPSSNAAKVAVSTLAAFSAFVASMM